MMWLHRSLPFSIPEVYEGFARAQGLMKVVENELVLELEVKEAIFDWIKLSSQSIGIPLAELESVTFKRGWFRDTLTVRVASLDCLKDVPKHENGRFKVYLSRQDRELSQEFSHLLQDRLLDLQIQRLESGPDNN